MLQLSCPHRQRLCNAFLPKEGSTGAWWGGDIGRSKASFTHTNTHTPAAPLAASAAAAPPPTAAAAAQVPPAWGAALQRYCLGFAAAPLAAPAWAAC
eukprot:1147497-Pelagomonas_calceolata.AAC.3